MFVEKLDLTKKYKSYYTAKAKPELITVDPAQYLSITGKGNPSERGFAEKLETIYPVAYHIKFMFKAEGLDFTVAKLEGLWWFDEEKYGGVGISVAPTKIPRSEWSYRVLIRLPEFVTEQHVQKAIQEVSAKKQLPMVNEVHFYQMQEGKVVQMMHNGPFDKEPETLLVMKAFMDERELKRNGLHHEIYLSDFRKTAPEKLKTILREPVK